ncbi:MAG: hypothetical protein H0W67_09555 [Gemmatimonadales bacterium]|nr:hypothetical protein [Gemmatimonadales bacterium]
MRAAYGEVGVEPAGSTVHYDEPVAVSRGHRFAALTGGAGSYCGITTAEETVCWGRGSSGELGSGHEDRTAVTAVPGF